VTGVQTCALPISGQRSTGPTQLIPVRDVLSACLVLLLPPWVSVSKLTSFTDCQCSNASLSSSAVGTVAHTYIFIASHPLPLRMCSPVASVPARAALRSAASCCLLIPDTRMSTVWRRGFYIRLPCSFELSPATVDCHLLSITNLF